MINLTILIAALAACGVFLISWTVFEALLMPLPEGVSKEEVDEAVKAGEIKLYDGMMTDEPKAWEERNGELWLEVGEGMSESGWVKLSDDDGHLLLMTIRYTKAN